MITHTYRYDHNGHRVYSSVDQTYTVRGAYGEPIAEYGGTTPALRYWNNVRPDGVVIGRQPLSGNPLYYHRDHLGSTRTVVNSSGSVVETYDYMPFGEFMSGRILTSGTGTRPKYTGHAFDDETNLHTMQWRRQIPRYGVFRTVDPHAASYPSLSPYVYAANNPLIFIDPDGRDFFRHDETGAILWRNSTDETYTYRDGTVYTNIGDTHQLEVDGANFVMFQTGEEGRRSQLFSATSSLKTTYI